MTSTTTFSELGICPEILEAIEVLGFETPSAIQAQAIPAALSGSDILGLSHTGSGKTLAFSIPALEAIDPGVRAVQVLCLCPTRELAVQICREVDKLALFLDGVSAVPIYGGASFRPQLDALQRGVQFVVGTPGRVMDLMEQGALRLDELRMLILDEADQMLDMGFLEDIERIASSLPEQKQTLFFSATMSPAIRHLLSRFTESPVEVNIERPTLTVPTIEQLVYEVVFSSRIEVLSRLMEMGKVKMGLVFANTKRVVDDIVDGLMARGYAVDRLHGDMPQNLRERVMDSFRRGNLRILVATDIAARGLDVDDVDAVVNFELPRDPEDYVHRIGRTARAGRKGKAISFIGRRDFSLLGRIERFIGTKMNRETVMTAEQVDQMRKEALVDDILERVKTGSGLPDEMREVELPAEELVAAMFSLLVSRTSREIQPIPEDKPSRYSRPRQADTDEQPAGEERYEKGHSWAGMEDTVTLFMNGGKMLGIRPKDIAGLLYNEGGAPKGTVGDIRMFPKHCLIEVDPSVAEQLKERLSTTMICGYEVNVREDKGKPAGDAESFQRPRSGYRKGNSYRDGGGYGNRRDRNDRAPRTRRDRGDGGGYSRRYGN
ncbi:DEAD/DEAH box helicase [Akkermansia glycaniphila]|uniref:RNA helicase n=1 Tax=Akkermansia glycaniphila TaxID=1679444 RepID=A0A1H6M3X6_9BACT|nr:DEAD/DEAH box helicase [Akkermansia glycaniphila]MBT9450534.1 DEAD/DEAH box helicase [Akkermansia glycaniphila]SEH92084.1 dead/deah box helicase [Akkermansia glycaniphila]